MKKTSLLKHSTTNNKQEHTLVICSSSDCQIVKLIQNDENCNYFFFYRVVLTRRQRNDRSVFESSCYLPNYLTVHGGYFTLYFLILTLSRKAVKSKFVVYGLTSTRPEIEPESTVRLASLYPSDHCHISSCCHRTATYLSSCHQTDQALTIG